MQIQIRQEQPADYPFVFNLIEAAFKTMKYSNHTEHFLVERLRKSEAFIPELSLVAVNDSQIVGHILLSIVKIKNEDSIFESLSLAPVSVLPEFQRKGIGGQLIKASHQLAKALGYKSVILLGHKDYYPRFGYLRADSFGIELPFDSPKENCMAIELVENGLKKVNGMVEYPKAFFE